MEKEKIRQEILKRIENETEKFFPVKSLEKLGFKRYQCKKCGKHFWSAVPRDICGDVECIGEYTFFDKPMTSKRLTYKQAWETFARIFKKFGHEEIGRYPVVARWRDDIYFVEAAIDDFAPYVLKGLVDPPANPLTVPQICLRFNDIQNVGMTGRHLTSFIMAEEAAFNSKRKKTYFDSEAIIYIYKFLIDGLGIKKEELTFVEDAWVGAGYAGNSLEFFAGGLELGNQVYMRYSIDKDALVEMATKTIDMGAGLERWAWISQRTPTIYESTFPHVIEMIKTRNEINYDANLLKEIYKQLGKYDFENADKEEIFKQVSNNLKIEEGKLREIIEKMSAIYKIADYTRTLLVAIHDGALPSNVGGGYNLREILRIAQSLIERYKFNITLNEVIDAHKQEFGSWFKELNDTDISKVIDKEIERYHEYQKENKQRIEKIINKGMIEPDEMRLLYESYGISPEDIKLQAEIDGKSIKIPEVRLTKASNKKEEKKLNIDLPKTKQLFYNENLLRAKAKIIKKLDKDKLVLDKTIFYPEMGGQKSDRGKIDDIDVIDVQIFDGVIVHYLSGPINKKEGNTVEMEIDNERRSILRRQHTATHIINKAARNVLGEFVNQYGAEKNVDKAHLDITYFDKLSKEQVQMIEYEANKIVSQNLKVDIEILPRDKAEKKYGMSIYQGGAIPASELRIVKINDYDVEACGGLHCNYTGEVGFIKIFNTEKIQDGVVRIEFSAFPGSLKYTEEIESIAKNLSEDWGVKIQDLYKTANKFFDLSKKYKSLYIKSESDRIYNLIQQNADKNIDIKTELEINNIINILSKLKESIKSEKITIRSGDTLVVFPASKKNQDELGKTYNNVINRGWFLIAHN